MLPWHRWREPLALVLLVALGGMLALRTTVLVYALAAPRIGLFSSIPSGDELLLLAATAAVVWCTTAVAGEGGVTPSASPHAWPIALAGLVVIGLTVLGWSVLAVWDLVTIAAAPPADRGFVLGAVEGLLQMAVPVAALVAVSFSVRRAAAARTSGRRAAAARTSGRRAAAARTSGRRVSPALTANQHGASVDDVPAEPPAPEPPVPERLPAAWQPDEATGAVWLTADDAAQGRPGLSWSSEPVESGRGWSSGPGSASESGSAASWGATRSSGPARSLPADGPVSDLPPDRRPGVGSAAEDDDLR